MLQIIAPARVVDEAGDEPDEGAVSGGFVVASSPGPGRYSRFFLISSFLSSSFFLIFTLFFFFSGLDEVVGGEVGVDSAEDDDDEGTSSLARTWVTGHVPTSLMVLPAPGGEDGEEDEDLPLAVLEAIGVLTVPEPASQHQILPVLPELDPLLSVEDF